MTIHLISFASILHKQVSLRSSHEAILSEIEKEDLTRALFVLQKALEVYPGRTE